VSARDNRIPTSSTQWMNAYCICPRLQLIDQSQLARHGDFILKVWSFTSTTQTRMRLLEGNIWKRRRLIWNNCFGRTRYNKQWSHDCNTSSTVINLSADGRLFTSDTSELSVKFSPNKSMPTDSMPRPFNRIECSSIQIPIRDCHALSYTLDPSHTYDKS
jgi:hypothetical protein